MLKRLAFLKVSLDQHSPRQTTNQMRLRTVQKRDMRVLETWKREVEHEGIVQSIIEEYKKQRSQDSILQGDGEASEDLLQDDT